jgi:plasmid stabilization system protein ParE
MDFKVFLSDDALSDLERIVAYIAPHNPVAAERMGNQLLVVAEDDAGTRPRGAGISAIGIARNYPSFVSHHLPDQ